MELVGPRVEGITAFFISEDDFVLLILFPGPTTGPLGWLLEVICC